MSLCITVVNEVTNKQCPELRWREEGTYSDENMITYAPQRQTTATHEDEQVEYYRNDRKPLA